MITVGGHEDQRRARGEEVRLVGLFICIYIYIYTYVYTYIHCIGFLCYYVILFIVHALCWLCVCLFVLFHLYLLSTARRPVLFMLVIR